MAGSPEDLERRIEALRAAVRQAVAAGDRLAARELRARLRDAQDAWDTAMAELESTATSPAAELESPATRSGRPSGAGSLLPAREQVHQALTLLGVAAAPRLIVAVHDAFFSGPLIAARLTSLRRDEERSFRSAPYARAYYLCAALTADLLGPARGLLAVSTWPLEQRVIGPLSPRVDFLTAAVSVAGHVERARVPSADAVRLLRRFAVSIPGADTGGRRPDPGTVAAAARAELEVHVDADLAQRRAAAKRARTQLDDTGQLFGSRFRPVGRAAVGS